MSREINAAKLSARIKEEAQRLGFVLAGVSAVKLPPHEESFARWLRQGLAGELGYMKRTEALRRDPEKLVPWAVSVISVGMNYYTEFPRHMQVDEARGWISRYAWGDDYHDVMKGKLDTLLVRVQELHPAPVQGRAFVDSGPVLERDLAGVAGLGWIGKNTHLISPKKGSWFFLGELFVDLPLAYDRPMRDRCGRCELCLKACPTKAFIGPYVLDARRCISYLTIEHHGAIPEDLRPAIGNRIFGCDDCQLVCPWNKFARVAAEPDFRVRHRLDEPDLVDLFAWTEPEYLEKTEGSALRRLGFRRWLRNLAVALGNAPPSARVVAALRSRAGSADPLVREHVGWALARQGGRLKAP